ncbi:hypothetical protein GIB67_040006 [Kingdonia uniflora]|uniref:J domain-containing protein n=1 Tax=Kingdonia uniflora TaxID=39325 RepID=A0A7J7LIC2_9MAGN|nr:hypothetical protein GIB67_040006 [Kingdonia uniflora]
MSSALQFHVCQGTSQFSSSTGTKLRSSPSLSPFLVSSPTSFPSRKLKITAYSSSSTETNTSSTLRYTVSKKPQNFYQVLSVNQNVSLTEIKTAYRNLAKRFHPDAATPESNSSDFIEIQRAYATLSDPTTRALYDLTITRAGAFQKKQFAYTASGKTMTRRWETDQCW